MPRAESSMTIPLDWHYKPMRPKLGSRAEVASAFWLDLAVVLLQFRYDWRHAQPCFRS